MSQLWVTQNATFECMIKWVTEKYRFGCIKKWVTEKYRFGCIKKWVTEKYRFGCIKKWVTKKERLVYDEVRDYNITIFGEMSNQLKMKQNKRVEVE